nr:hypothetical protein [Streptomyces sp. CB01580]
MLGAEFIAATGGDMTAFGSPDRLAGVAGLPPSTQDAEVVDAVRTHDHPGHDAGDLGRR